MPSRYHRRTILRNSAAAAAALAVGAAAPSARAAAVRPSDEPPVPHVPGMRGDLKANEFWYQYDVRFLYDPLPEVSEAFARIAEALGPVEGGFYGAWAASRAAGTYPGGYVETIAATRAPLAVVSHHQVALMDEFYGRDPHGLVEAFTDFGQGLLYDPRRPDGQKVHLMDYTNGVDPPGGYHVWHSINRASMLLDIDTAKWRLLDPVVALAWAVQSIAKPAVDSPDNPPLSPRMLARLRAQWLTRTPAQLDTAYDSIPYPPEIQ